MSGRKIIEIETVVPGFMYKHKLELSKKELLKQLTDKDTPRGLVLELTKDLIKWVADSENELVKVQMMEQLKRCFPSPKSREKDYVAAAYHQLLGFKQVDNGGDLTTLVSEMGLLPAEWKELQSIYNLSFLDPRDLKKISETVNK